MFRVPIWMMSAASSTASAFSVSISSVTMPMPVLSRHFGEDLQPFEAHAPGSAYGLRPRLERPGPQQLHARG